MSSQTLLPLLDLVNPFNLFDDFETVGPSREELLARWRQNFDPVHATKSQSPRELNVDVVLTPEQALAGGSVPMEFPVARVCPRCDGSGSTGFYRCDQCDGHGLEWRTARVDVLFPRPVHDGTVITASLNHLGVQNFYLCVRARVMSTA